MKNMKIFSSIVGIAFVFVVLVAGAFIDDDPKGKNLFEEKFKCNVCHDVKSAEIEATTKSEKMKGPDLSGYSTDKSLAEVAAYVRKEAEIDGKTHKKPFKGTDEELQTILDWLGSLEAQE